MLFRSDPNVRVSCGTRRRTPATATALPAQQSAAALENYAQRHPKAWAALRATIEHAVGHPVDTLPMVALRLHNR